MILVSFWQCVHVYFSHKGQFQDIAIVQKWGLGDKNKRNEQVRLLMNEHVYLFSFIFYRCGAEFDMWIIAYHPVNLYYLPKKQQTKNGTYNFLS